MKKTKHLLVVESPTKAKTIKKYLGSGFDVVACMGHIKDLPKQKLGVDVKKGFKADYVVIADKKKVIAEIQDAAKEADEIYLGSDPDREGEAIAWHIAEEIVSAKSAERKKIHRVLFNSITKDSVKKAISEPLALDEDKINSQQTRRILDRLVGYQISPILWAKVRRGLSAGRVQSVALRLVVEREKDIAKFVPEEYWEIAADVAKKTDLDRLLRAKLVKIDGKSIEIAKGDEAKKIVANLKAAEFKVASVDKKERKRHASPPFITSKLQQEASRKLGFSASKTMMLAQRLYEGVELGKDGSQGLITYMRTDSVRVVPEAQIAAWRFIKEKYGVEYLPENPPVYKSKKSSQDAHEAIRPANLAYPPELVKAFLEKDMYRLYQLIWNRFISSQMKSATMDMTRVDISAGQATFRLNGSVVTFPGFMAAYVESKDEDAPQKRNSGTQSEDDSEDDSDQTLPVFTVGDILHCKEVIPSQHFTQPPPRYTDATLIKDLEEKGIGRPSTYASILSNILKKMYVEKRERRYFATRLGMVVMDLLIDNFPRIMDVDFTASMEEQLDQIEEGKLDWKKALSEFYLPFEATLAEAKENMKNLKAQEIPTDFVCEKCGNPMVIKWGRNGEFISCKTYPECRNTKEFTRTADGKIEIVPEMKIDPGIVCPKCQSPMLLKKGRFGQFLARSKYPECKTTQSITASLGVTCPKCNKGDLVKKNSSKTRRVFYGCNRYPDCDYIINDLPVPKECPDCKAKFLLEKKGKRGSGVLIRYCVTDGCEFREEILKDDTSNEDEDV